MTIHMDAVLTYVDGAFACLMVLLFSALCIPFILSAFMMRRLLTGGLFSLMYAGSVFFIVGIATSYVQFAH